MYRKLQAHSGDKSILSEEIADYKRVMDRKGEHFVSKDTLDLGMSLWTAHWLANEETWAAKLANQCTQQLRRRSTCSLYQHQLTVVQEICSKKMGTCNLACGIVLLSATSELAWA